MFTVSAAWKSAFPGAAAGVLAMRNVVNPEHHAGLEPWIAACEQELRTRFHGSDRAALRARPPIEAYVQYYRRYRKTYHVLLQLESVALKGKPIPRRPALVGAMVTAELKNGLLTAGHDREAIAAPVTLDLATGQERYRLLNGQEQTLEAGDMMMADGQGVISSVLYGPDQRTRLTPHTRHVLFAVYAPPGIGEPAVARHLEDLRSAVLLIAPSAEVEALDVYGSR